MSSRLFRPENAQKRAKEFLDVGKPSRALDVLYEVIRRGKMRNNTSEKVLEPIMFMYLKLCVDLKKSHLAKEGLYQYRNIFQTVNVSTLELVVRSYLEMAEERTEAARKESHEAVTTCVDDLDQLATPEEMLLSAVSGEDAQDRSDRTILTPWVKFLWESYRQCLELLRNNSLVEKLYHEIAKKAFKFCERYQRKTEFRKLCDNLVNHLQHLQKPPTSARAVSLSNPETQQMNLETRLEQLNFAIKMELWQEAYRAIEYVSDLMGKGKKSPKPQIMSSYYSKLSLVFWKAGNQLFHAAALLKLFQLNKEQKKNITHEEVSKRAAVVLLAALAIPLPSSHPEFDRFIETEKSAMEKHNRLAALLNLPKPPTRIGLFKELVRCGVMSVVSPDLQSLYKTLEVDFDPLQLCSSMEKKLQGVSQIPEFQQYVPAIKEMTVTRFIKQLAQIYSTVTFEWLLQNAVFVEKFKLERLLVDLVRHNDQQIRIDHRNGCVHFGTALSECQREDLPEGPTLQSMPSETIRCQLVNVNTAINHCLQLIQPDAKKKEMESVRAQSIAVYNQTKSKEHSKILQRQYTIECRKERLENQTLEREENIRRAHEEAQQKQKVEELERLKREATEREKQRHEEQLRQIQTKQIKDKLMQISQTSYGQKMMEKFNEEELLNLDAEEILQKQVEELEKERKELQQRLKAQEKKIDYVERAKRIVEIPKFNTLYENQKEKDKEFWKIEEEKRVKKLVEEHRQNLEMCKRFNHLKGDLNKFLDGLKAARRSETEKKMSDFKARIDVERKKRLQERKEQRRRERREAYLKEKQEEEQRRIDEELKKERENKEAEELERQKKEEEEYARHVEELERQERLRKEKEMEVERKIKERDGGGAAPASQAWRGGSRDTREKEIPSRAGGEDSKPGFWRPQSSGVWREKEQEKLDVWRKKREESSEDSANVAPPTKREMGSKDIRLDDDFKEDLKRQAIDGDGDKLRHGDEERFQRRTDDRPPVRRDDGPHRDGDRVGGGGGPRRDDDRFGGPRSEDDRFGGPRRDDDRFGGPRNEDDRFGGPRRDDRFGGQRRDDRFGGPRRDDDKFGGPRRDNDRFGGPRRDDDRYGGPRRDDDRFGERGGGGFQRSGGGDRLPRRGGGGYGDKDRRWNDDDRRSDFRRGGDGEGEWRRDGGVGPPMRGGGPPSRRDGGGGRDFERRPMAREDEDGGGGSWRSKGSSDHRGAPIRRDDDDKRGGGPPPQGEAWRRGGDGPGGREDRGGKQSAPIRRDKVEPDAEGWTKVRK